MKIVRPINTKGQGAVISQGYSFLHKGIDYAYPEGTPVYASHSGKVTIATNLYSTFWRRYFNLTNADYGNLIKIDHLDGYSTLYAHLQKDSLKVKIGQMVKIGQKIAGVGRTGNTGGGRHLHWELRQGNSSVNPVPYVDFGFKTYFG